ncbi:hypothetical protein IV203_030540 [Nitzschia inconspicua]|uniref:Uncharacterized protein n=1 Tax=Nitzschia inconspicua TaxID=303405 RepID=A0A9K3Q1B7_9STRA|nr:hypothetical protein IV203_030540 [Nitzschia inconspicua]
MTKDTIEDEFVQPKTNRRTPNRRRSNNNNNNNNNNRNTGSGRGKGTGQKKHTNNGRSQNVFQKKGWAKPTSSDGPISNDHPTSTTTMKPSSFLPYEDPISEEIASMVTSQFQEHIDDEITTALASTAAITFYASVASAASESDSKIDMDQLSTELSQQQKDDYEVGVSDFASMMKLQNMAEMLADFGQQDFDWKKKEIRVTSTPQDTTADIHVTSLVSTPTSSSTFPNRLAPHGKAPIHILLQSFGYIHSAPESNSKSWSPYSQPLPALDIRSITEQVPTHLLFHDGLHSGVIKRLLREQQVDNEKCRWKNVDDDNDQQQPNSNASFRNLQDYSRRFIAQQWIYPKLVEAMTEGQHGYVNPVIMTIAIGSHLGRHRSVVVVEWVATELRKLLRQNKDGTLAVPVSVETVHRDVDKKVPANATGKQRNKKDTHKDDADSDNDQV